MTDLFRLLQKKHAHLLASIQMRFFREAERETVHPVGIIHSPSSSYSTGTGSLRNVGDILNGFCTLLMPPYAD